MDLTQSQREKMLHAVGGVLDGSGYRNYYSAGEPDPDWEALVEAGFAARRDRGPELGGICYHVTVNGCNALRGGVKMVPDDWVRWLRSNALALLRRGGPSMTMGHNMESCAKKMEEMRDVLRQMASQRLRDEMDDDALEGADFEGAYDLFIEQARAVVGPLPVGKNG